MQHPEQWHMLSCPSSSLFFPVAPAPAHCTCSNVEHVQPPFHKPSCVPAGAFRIGLAEPDPAISAQKTYLSLQHAGYAYASCSIQSSLPSHDFKYWFYLPHTSHAPFSPHQVETKTASLQLTHVSHLNSRIRFLARALHSYFHRTRITRQQHDRQGSACSH